MFEVIDVEVINIGVRKEGIWIIRKKLGKKIGFEIEKILERIEKLKWLMCIRGLGRWEYIFFVIDIYEFSIYCVLVIVLWL